MTRFTTLYTALAAVVCLVGTEFADAGSMDCGCSQHAEHGSPMMYAPPTMHAAPVMDSGDSYVAAVPSCCGAGGVGGGLAGLGSLYGSPGIYGGGRGFGSWRSPDPRSFESGFESLPNMDGGGVHHRLPFHSYRRPWAHPGIADNNINIIW